MRLQSKFDSYCGQSSKAASVTNLEYESLCLDVGDRETRKNLSPKMSLPMQQGNLFSVLKFKREDWARRPLLKQSWRRSTRNWRMSTRSSSRRRGHQAASIGLQLAAASWTLSSYI